MKKHISDYVQNVCSNYPGAIILYPYEGKYIFSSSVTPSKVKEVCKDLVVRMEDVR